MSISIDEWLTNWSLAEYAELFASHGYTDLTQCTNLSDQVLDALGIVKVGHRRRLLTASSGLENGRYLPSAPTLESRPSVTPRTRQDTSTSENGAPPSLPPRANASVLSNNAPPPPVPPRHPGVDLDPSVPPPALPSRPGRPSASDSKPPPVPKRSVSDESVNAGHDPSTIAPSDAGLGAPLVPVPLPRKPSTRSSQSSVTPSTEGIRHTVWEPETPIAPSVPESAPETQVTAPALNKKRPAPPPPSNRSSTASDLGSNLPPIQETPPQLPARPMSQDVVFTPSVPDLPAPSPSIRAPMSIPETPTHPEEDDGEDSDYDPEEMLRQVTSGFKAPGREPQNDGGEDDDEEEDEEEGIYEAVPVSARLSALQNRLSMQSGHNVEVPLPDSEPKHAEGKLVEVKLTAKNVQAETKSGWLWKKGGKLGNKGWDHRWFVYEQGVLKYFEKCNPSMQASGTIPLSDMKEVIQGADVKDPRHPYQFELLTSNRTYFLAAETLQDMTAWMLLLGAVILETPSAKKADLPSQGMMYTPDKDGWILKQGTNFREGWMKRYMAIKDGTLCYYNDHRDFLRNKPLEVINTLFITIKIGKSGKKKALHRFQLVNNNNQSFEFQAETNEEMMAWVAAIQNSILWSFTQVKSAPGDSRPVVETVPTSSVLPTLQECDPGNKACVDCDTPNPEWASINLGVLFCSECSGIHRNLGVHITKVRSAKLDDCWTPSLMALMKGMGNTRANKFWEASCTMPKLTVNSTPTERTTYLQAKYRDRAFVTSTLLPGVSLSEQLCEVIKGEDILLLLEVIVAGAEKACVDPLTGNTPYQICKDAGKIDYCELLYQNGFTAPNHSSERAAHPSPSSPSKSDSTSLNSEKRDSMSIKPPTFIQGFLHKRGEQNTDWKKRWCVFETGILSYYKSDVEREAQGKIDVRSMLSVKRREEKDATFQHRFEVLVTTGRYFHFAADNEETMNKWIGALLSSMSEVPSTEKQIDLSSCSKTGFLQKRGERNPAFKRRWFALKGKTLLYFKGEGGRDPAGDIDLRTITKMDMGTAPQARMSLSRRTGPSGGDAAGCDFYLSSPERVFQLRADTPDDARNWVSAIKLTQVFGSPLQAGITEVPLIVNKCCNFIEDFGMKYEGIYRKNGRESVLKELKTAFNQDDEAVILNGKAFQCDAYDVASLLKLYFRELPEPLLTTDLSPLFTETMLVVDHNEKLYGLQGLIDRLPPVNKETFKKLCLHLLKLTTCKENKMNPANLGLVVGPNLMPPPSSPTGINAQIKCMEYCITYAEWLFRVEASGDGDKQAATLEDGIRKIEEAMKKHDASLRHNSVAGMTGDATVIIEVFFDASVVSRAIPIKPSMNGKEVTELCREKGEYAASSDWTLFEVVNNASYERPIETHENVMNVVSKWETKNCHFRLKKNSFSYLLSSMLADGQTKMEGTLLLKQKRGWKEMYFACDARTTPTYLYAFKDKNEVVESEKILLTGTMIYTSLDTKKMESPFGFLVKSRDREDLFCCRTQSESEQWKVFLTIAKDYAFYSKLMTSSASSDDDQNRTTVPPLMFETVTLDQPNQASPEMGSFTVAPPPVPKRNSKPSLSS